MTDPEAHSGSEASFLDEAYRVEAPGAELYLELVGPTDAPVIFYLHGGPGYNSHSFRELMSDELQDYRVIYADQRGAGRSPAEAGADLSVQALAGDVLSILDALGLPQATLLAHGFGAFVAAEVARRAPERTERLVWVNPWVDMSALARTLQREAARLGGDDAAEAEGEGDGLSPAERVAQASREVGGKRLFDALLFSKTSSRLRLEHTDAEGFADLQDTALQEGESDTLWSLQAELTPLSEQQAPIPTVVLVGQQDKSCYPTQAEIVLRALPHALFSLLESAHYPWLDDPETFTALLQQALGLPTTAPTPTTSSTE